MTEYHKDLKQQDLEPHYRRHVEAIETESLRWQSDIAKQLAWRDQTIERLKTELAEAHARDAESDSICAQMANVLYNLGHDAQFTDREREICRELVRKRDAIVAERARSGK